MHGWRAQYRILVTTQVKDNNHVLFHLILVLLSYYIV